MIPKVQPSYSKIFIDGLKQHGTRGSNMAKQNGKRFVNSPDTDWHGGQLPLNTIREMVSWELVNDLQLVIRCRTLFQYDSNWHGEGKSWKKQPTQKDCVRLTTRDRRWGCCEYEAVMVTSGYWMRLG